MPFLMTHPAVERCPLSLSSETVNRSAGWVGEQSYARAVLYKPVREVSRWVFPYLSRAAEKLADRENTSE